ncbi:hypothetical protein SDC9_159123 [bioreactor metagenome]|uniref:Uncharacterized protein n=1 Tax=bioreactor metagenome TaxID=1076179 RepID=A0A645FBS4_9ZZZZ
MGFKNFLTVVSGVFHLPREQRLNGALRLFVRRVKSRKLRFGMIDYRLLNFSILPGLNLHPSDSIADTIPRTAQQSVYPLTGSIGRDTPPDRCSRSHFIPPL